MTEDVLLAEEQATDQSFEDWLMSLDDNAEEQFPSDDQPVDEGTILFRIRTMMDKQKMLEQQKKAYLERRQKEIEEFYDPQIQTLQENIDSASHVLQEIIRTAKERNPKYTCKTPYGTAFIEKPRYKIQWDDETVLGYLRNTGQDKYIRVRESVDKQALGKVLSVDIDIGTGDFIAIDPNGEIVEGAKPEQPEDTLRFRWR